MIRIRNAVVKGLHEFTDLLVVPQNSIPEKPSYPYLAYTFISPYIQARMAGNLSTTFEPSTDERFEHDVVEKLELQPTMTLSVSAYSSGKADDDAVAYGAMKKALDFFRHSGYQYLSDNNIVVVSIEAVGNRTALIIDNYETRYGFDIVMRFTDIVDLRYETIENWEINTEIN